MGGGHAHSRRGDAGVGCGGQGSPCQAPGREGSSEYRACDSHLSDHVAELLVVVFTLRKVHDHVVTGMVVFQELRYGINVVAKGTLNSISGESHG